MGFLFQEKEKGNIPCEEVKKVIIECRSRPFSSMVFRCSANLMVGFLSSFSNSPKT